MSKSPDVDDIQRLIRGFTEEMQKSHGDVPESLYHYTDANSLEKIVDSGQLWATHFAFLNDSTELVHGYNIAFEVLRELKGRFVGTAATALSDVFDPHRNASVPGPSLQVFVCCLSTKSDHLGQWRAYGGEGSGFSIGFDTNGLQNSLSRIPSDDALPSRPALFRVEYSIERQRELLTRHLGSILELGKDSDDSTVAMALYLCIWQCAVHFKNPSFAEEGEWRIALTIFDDASKNNLVRARTARGKFVPFVAIDVAVDGRLPLSSIHRGPRQTTDGRFAEFEDLGLRRFLTQHGYRDVEKIIQKSSIPFR
jgi:hypothetical protein